jgi:mannose-6-phosphate isomerase-like protein (cupin superfamily)
MVYRMSTSKIVYKPWGEEEWLELNDRYCYKRIYINAGYKTSLQYHNLKLETNYLIEGEAEIWLENDAGDMERTSITAGDFFTVTPPRRHQISAITNIILQEVSTPEVDDVIRIDDEFSRGNGRILSEHMRPALCILAAGLGSRLGDLSKHTNKALLPLDNKAIISHLIDKAPCDYDIVIAVGYKGNMVREYCQAAHPERNFVFVEVDKYEGVGTGPSYSIAQCKPHLQRPFIWATADTLIADPLPKLDTNWLAFHPTSIPELYSTGDIDNGNVVAFKNKDSSGYPDAFIGIASVYDYETFWNELSIESGEIVSAYYDLSRYSEMKAKILDWYDVGTIDNYIKAKKRFETSPQYSIPKINGEFLYKVNNTYIKLSSDGDFIQGRINRSFCLKGFVPSITYKGSNVYAYDWIGGDTLYSINKPDIFIDFLSFAKEHLWKVEDEYKNTFQDICRSFYHDKTRKRLDLFLKNREKSFEGAHVVNEVHTEPIGALLSYFPWDRIYDGVPTKMFHGDFQFDNIIYGDDKKFYLLDWRQNFAGGDVGDVYYDLAKMYGGIIMSYKLMKSNKYFSCSVIRNTVTYQHDSVHELDSFRAVYEQWIVDNGYSLEKVKLITSLIYLNMSPLHEKELGDLLFFKSKELLQRLKNDR